MLSKRRPSHQAGDDSQSKTEISQLYVDLLVRSDAGFTIEETTGVLFGRLHHSQL